MRQIIRVIRHMLRERRWWHLPRYTFGSSSGGVIALELPLRFPFQARWVSLEVGCRALGRWAAVCRPGCVRVAAVPFLCQGRWGGLVVAMKAPEGHGPVYIMAVCFSVIPCAHKRGS